MKDRLVNTCTTILRTISSGGQNVSMIIQQTSPDRSHVIKAIEELHKAKIVSREKNPKHKQGIIVRPTDLGLELKKLMQDVTHYNESFLAFKRSLDEHFRPNRGFKFRELEDGRQVDHQTTAVTKRLEKRKWTPYEISHFVKWADGTDFVIHTCRKNILISLFFKYVLIYYSYNINEKAQSILRKIIIDEITLVLSNISWRAEQVRKSDSRSVLQKQASVYIIFSHFYDFIKQDIFDYLTGKYDLSSCRYIEQELRDLIQSLLSILNTTNNSLELPLSEEIASLEDKIGRLKSKDYSKIDLDEQKSNLEGHEELLSIFKASIGRSS